MKRIYIYLLACLLPFSAWSQSHDDKKDFESGLGFGVFGHSYGLGFNVEYWKAGNENDMIFSLAMSSYRTKQEQKVESFYKDQGGKDYVFDKKNYFYTITPSIGISREVIRKSPHNRVSLRVGGNAGFNLGILKPYYIEVAVPISPTQARVQETKYDGSQHSYIDIVGEADYFLGFNELSVVPGLHLEANSMLDFSRGRDYIRGIELAVFTDLFTQKVELMDLNENKQVFLGVKLGLLIGNTW